MIRILLDRAFDNERHYIHAVGLNTDAKPTTGIITGSKFVAVDTGASYLFDETAGEWNKIGDSETGGGNDFIVTIDWDDTQEMYIPDRTFAEIQSAYNAGKNIVCAANPTNAATVVGYFVDEDMDHCFYYNVAYIDPSIGAYFGEEYQYYEHGIEGPYKSPPFYMTLQATATPADVASGKIFFNANGRQTGTATLGGG